MSIKLVEDEIRRFLSSSEPEVVCITGQWGVGKTFAWNRYLRDARTKNQISLKRYSYVSLFGINSLDDLKYSIFENTVDTPSIGSAPTAETMRSNMIYAAGAWVRKLAVRAKQTPVLNNYLGGIMPMWFAAVGETVVCIDDFERRGEGLAVRDTLGLVNNLKELKKCKVCLILNDEALEEHGADFRKYLEKVVDVNLKFAPSAEECARIALAEHNLTSKLLAECCIRLGISNIRVIMKIERSILRVRPIVAEFDDQVLRQAVQSLALLGWSTHEPSRAPSIEYLRRRSEISFPDAEEKNPIPDKEAAWNALLIAYEFGSMDEFDLALFEGIQNGFFDTARVKKAASELNNKIKAGNLDASFTSAWRMYHDSFDDNQEEVLDAMYKSFVNAIQYITPMNLSSTITLFKKLGRKEQASNMLKRYVDVHSAEPEIFNLGNQPFSDRVSDPDVVEAFKEKYAASKHVPDAKAILSRIADSKSWNPEDIFFLSSLPVDHYYEMLKNSKGHDLRKILSASLLFDNVATNDPSYKEIPKRAKEALKRIGRESGINAQRVKSYGVEVDSAAPPTQGNAAARPEEV